MRFATLVSAGCLLAATGVAHAQATAAAGSVMVIPVVAETTSYSTEVIVRNPGTTAITVNVKFYEANNSGAGGGLRACSPIAVGVNRTVQFTMASQCSLGSGNHFGMLVLEDAATPKTDVFYAYSRAQTPGGNGFSVEGFPAGAFSGADADVVGLKRQASSPTYQSNCFIGALDEGFNYSVMLWDSNNQLIGSIPGSLGPYQNTRLFDVFALAGAPAGDHSNVRATFMVTSSGKPAMVPFCTVQESTFFGADFRIGKSVDALNNGQRREACIGMDNCNDTTASLSQPEQITSVSLKNVYSMIITQPDYVRCDLVGDTASLQIRLREWGDPFASPVFPAAAPYSSGGSGKTFFYIYTGGRNAVNGGTASRWFIDVAARTGAAGTPPFKFGITCTSGNGTEVPWLRGTVANDFS